MDTVTGKGRIEQYIPALTKAIRHGFQNIGWREIPQEHRDNKIKMEIRTAAARIDGGVHHLFNYDLS